MATAVLEIRSIALFPKSVYLADCLRTEGVQHVHAHFATHPTTTAFIISRLTGVSFSFTVHAHDLFVPWRRALMRTKIKNAGFVRAISETNRTYLRARYPAASDGKIEVIHVGIEPGRYDRHPPASLDTPTSQDSRCVRLLSVAALQPYKGLPFLLEACQRLKDDGVACHCDIVGEGPLHAHLDQLRREMGLEEVVTLLGPKTQGLCLAGAAT